MRELRALGLTDDGKSLVLVDLSRGAEGERFRVAADDRLRAALRSGAPRAAQAETRVESALSPREIQARLRAGATADEVAKAAGIPVNRIQRYEAPILAERDRVVSEARRASAPGPHRNTPGRPLGTLVDDRLEQEAVEPESATWDAKRRNDGTWLVTLSMDARGPVRATWSWDPQARRVRAVDAGATAVLAPMPPPAAGPDSLTALAEAAGVASAEVPNEAAERQAVGDDGRRRGGLPQRGGSSRAGGLVVLAGRNTDTGTSTGTGTGTPRTRSTAAHPAPTRGPGARRSSSTPTYRVVRRWRRRRPPPSAYRHAPKRPTSSSPVQPPRPPRLRRRPLPRRLRLLRPLRLLRLLLRPRRPPLPSGRRVRSGCPPRPRATARRSAPPTRTAAKKLRLTSPRPARLPPLGPQRVQARDVGAARCRRGTTSCSGPVGADR